MKADLRVEVLMTKNPFLLRANHSLREAWELFSEHKISGAPVVDDYGVLIGILSQSDLVREAFESTFSDFSESTFFIGLPFQENELGAAPASRLASRKVEDAMHQGAVAVTANETIKAAALSMREQHVHRVIVVDDQATRRVVGLLSVIDILKVFEL